MIIVIFTLWLLPLGAFIKPAQEKIACGGQRAICLCSHAKAKVSGKAIESGVGLKVGNSSGKEKESSGGAGHYLSRAAYMSAEALRLSSHFERQHLRYKNPFLASLEYVPKA